MQTVRLLQAVALMLVVALAASCTSTREYTSKLFAPRVPVLKDSQATAIRFLETGDAETNTSDWVSTAVFMGRDSSNSTAALDQFTRSFPAQPVPAAGKPAKDSVPASTDVKNAVLVKAPDLKDEPVARSGGLNGVRDKKTRE